MIAITMPAIASRSGITAAMLTHGNVLVELVPDIVVGEGVADISVEVREGDTTQI